MSFEFKKGVYYFHKDPNFNYQLNRWMTFGNIPMEDIQAAAQKITTLADWYREFYQLAAKANKEGNVLKEACCLRAVDFFLNYSDNNKESNYDRLTALFREAYKKCFSEKRIIEHSVEYDGVTLPVWHVIPVTGSEKKGTILMTGGFDCYKEELVPVMLYFSDLGYDFYYFEGPGQGEVLVKKHYPMTPEWEKPVMCVLDAFKLSDVTIIGLSLAGYLAPRAAVYDQRITRVISWGTMYDFYDVVSTRKGPAIACFIRSMVALHCAPALNIVLGMAMKKDPYIFWGIDHGMHVMGTPSPYTYFKKLKLFSLKKIASKVTQDFLLMTGTKDHFVDMKMFYQMQKSLTHTASLTSRIFTEEEGAENHCQFGNLKLALDTMSSWISVMDASRGI